jgi:hypothetical protein
MNPIKWNVVTKKPYFATASVDVGIVNNTVIRANMSIQQTIQGDRYASTLLMTCEETSMSIRDVADSIDDAQEFLTFVCSQLVQHGTVSIGIDHNLGEPS